MDGDGDADARVPLLRASLDGGLAAPDAAPSPAAALFEMEYAPFLDEGLLQELRSIHEHDVEAGAAAGGGAPEELPHADDEVFKARARATLPLAASLAASLAARSAAGGGGAKGALSPLLPPRSRRRPGPGLGA